jgi:predicted DNA binding CopG/RHH family protein
MKKEYNFEKMKEVKNPYPSQKKKAVGINLSSSVIDYFKKLSADTGVPYQKLIDLYLLDCVKNKKKISMKWTA